MNFFHPAKRQKRYLKMLVTGAAGAGKTMTALTVASQLGNKIAVLDTERGSASVYADRFTFDVLTIGPGALMPNGLPSLYQDYHPDHFRDVVEMAVDAGYDVLVIDSLSHEWAGVGGALDIKSELAKKMDNFSAWKPVDEMHEALLRAISDSDIHVIATLRVRTKTFVEETESANGQRTARQRTVTTSPVMRDSIEYEFDFCASVEDGKLTLSKARAADLTDTTVSFDELEPLVDELAESLGGEDRPKPPTYADGSAVAIFNSAELNTYHQYVAEFGEPPESRSALRRYARERKTLTRKPDEATEVATTAKNGAESSDEVDGDGQAKSAENGAGAAKKPSQNEAEAVTVTADSAEVATTAKNGAESSDEVDGDGQAKSAENGAGAAKKPSQNKAEAEAETVTADSASAGGAGFGINLGSNGATAEQVVSRIKRRR